jgi:4-hydroxybenzoate polyprenyltransferase
MQYNSKLIGYINSMRPKQWIKNGFVFAGLIFSASFFNLTAVVRSIAMFVLFALVSGCVYIINDIVDRKKDAHHPVKCRRPIASGLVEPAGAAVFAAIILLISFLASFYLDVWAAVILATYFILNILYSLILKNLVIIDVIVIAFGFVLRTLAGVVVIRVSISPWLVLCTTMLALFLALHKRRSELLVLAGDAENHRKILGEYTPELIENMLSVITSTTVMSYALYTFSTGHSYYMMLTIPFVIYGIFRYQYLVYVKGKGGSPELVLLNDKPLLIDIILWVISCIIIVMLF